MLELGAAVLRYHTEGPVCSASGVDGLLHRTYREQEREIGPVCIDQGLPWLPWST